MKIVFTTNNLPGSWLIRWGVSNSFFGLVPVSHVLIEFDNKICFQSELAGTNIEWLSQAQKRHRFIYKCELDFPTTLELEERIYQDVIEEHVGGGYDYMAIVYIAWVCLVRKTQMAFGRQPRPFPARNPLGSERRIMCMELLEGLDKKFAEVIGQKLLPDGADLEMIDPWRVLNMLRTNKNVRVTKVGD